jgi:hypothetical protein
MVWYGIADPLVLHPLACFEVVFGFAKSILLGLCPSCIPKRGNCAVEYAFGKAKYNLIHTT